MDGASILVADSDEASRRLLTRILTRDGYSVRVVDTPDAALAACAAQPPDVVLLDLVAGDAGGFAVCRCLKADAATRLIPVVIVTAEGGRADRLRAIEAGADDFLLKPFDFAELRARIGSLVRLKHYTDELEHAESVLVGLGATIEARDSCTRGHCQRLADYATTLGQSIGLGTSDLRALQRGAFLHDVGKIAVPDSVLLKEGRLDADESRIMRKHPIVGDQLCAGLRSLADVRPIVRHHHERLDGSGYPDGLRSHQVPLLAQIVAVVDIFDALTTERPYRHPIAAALALEMIEDEARRGWRDRVLVGAFIEIVGGAIVREPR